MTEPTCTKQLRNGNWLYLQEVTHPLGAWKWASTRRSMRIVETTMDPEVWGVRRYTGRPTSGIENISESGHYTGDYAGGRWGYGDVHERYMDRFNRRR